MEPTSQESPDGTDTNQESLPSGTPSLDQSLADTDLNAIDFVETLGAIYVQMSRVYDVLMVQLRQTDPELWKSIFEHHEQGKLLSPPPAISEYGEL